MLEHLAPPARSDDVLSGVDNALPFIRAAADRAERERAVPAESIRLLADAGVFRILQPARYGGMEGSLSLFFDAIAAVGGACASTGWVAGVLGTHQWVIANFTEAAQDDVWKDDPTNVLSGSAAPASVVAVAVPGGYRVSGTWRFCSGSNHAQWHFGGVTIRDPKPGMPQKALMLLPVSDLEFVDNWVVNGLCATASCDGIARDAFVPEHRVLALPDLLAGQTPGQAVNTGPLYRFPLATVVALGIAAPPIGATGSALADFVDDTRTRERTGGVMGDRRKMWESSAIQLRIGEAATMYDASRALIARTIEEAQHAIEDGPLSKDIRVRVRRDLSFGVHTGVQVMAMLYRTAGTEVMFPPNALERAWRDVNAAAKHVGLNWDNMGTGGGRFLLGLEPQTQH